MCRFLVAFLFVIVAVLVEGPATALARTWFVEKDGTGEFASIHNAMIACSAGDTIMIGPGRYDDFHPLTAPAWTTEVVVGITKDNLTFVGSGSENTIIGPSEMYLPPGVVPEPMAIASVEDVEATFVNIGIENTRNGIYWAFGQLEVVGCRFDGCKDGVYLFNEGGASIRNSAFYSDESAAVGVVTFWPCGPIDIVGCTFGGPDTNEKGVSFNGTTGGNVESCHFSARTAVVYSGSSGSVTDCSTTEAVRRGVVVASGSQVELFRNQLHGDFVSLSLDSGSQVVGTENVFTGGTQTATIYVTSESTVQLNNNHILKSGDLAVELRWFFGALVEQDFAGNYWGTTDTDSILAWIRDVSDDPAIHSAANFLPIADGPVSTESTSLGSFKSMFR